MNARVFNGGEQVLRYRVVISLAAVAMFAWAGSAAERAQAQQPKPRPVEMALVGPGTLLIPGIGTVEGVLSAADAARYARVFELQETGEWKSADAIIARIRDRRLMGHVLAQRYLHPTLYRSRFSELRAWMAAYADHPQARRIHRLTPICNRFRHELSHGLRNLPHVNRARPHAEQLAACTREHREP